METRQFDAADYLTDMQSRAVYVWEGIKSGSAACFVESIKTVFRSMKNDRK